jgi:hypothetical protein
VRVCGLKSLVDYFNVKTCDVWEVNVTTRREILIEKICSLGFKDIREGLTIKDGDSTEVRVLESRVQSILY